MAPEIYNKSIETCELQLPKLGDKVTHFGVVGYLLVFPTMIWCFHLVDFVIGNPISFRDGEIWLSTIPAILAIIAYRIQKQRLKFRVIKINLKKEELKKLIIEVAKELEWERGTFSTKTYISSTNPRWWSGSWGEQITILFSEDYIYINSICDLNKRSSIVSWGRNRRNENTLIERINKADELVKG